MEDELRLVGCLYFIGGPRKKKEFFVITVKYGNVQEMSCGFIQTITVAKASRVSKNTRADSREICFAEHGRNHSQIDGKTPINFRRVRISLLGSEVHFCDVLSILSCHQINSWRKEVTQLLQNGVLHPRIFIPGKQGNNFMLSKKVLSE